ncbi:hypothetical protein EIP91_000219 [Steccherinum ochraceum]|uniref:Glucose-methanol-choline oxidoreductase N-terminal domain-containing protein n=1 Tax=Steccherinum ochraceum TaxID=92696 RepID=A0A4R0RJP4_9APHY|nr:hypothetical protein EIP91_000219 [Steccherinum ochraceum]
MTSHTLDSILAEGPFDYVVIGAGTAGLTLAARLTEDPSVSVLVLEAGGDNINDADILRPVSYGVHLGNEAYSWSYNIVKQQHSREAVWFRGKGLGGSSAINFMCYTRAPASDIDERLGNPGFNSERLTSCLQRARAEGSISFPPNVTADIELMFQQVLEKNGISAAPDPFGGDSNGYWLIPNNYDPATHTRSYSATAFYFPNRHRPNFKVLLYALATRLVTERGDDGMLVATGVELMHDGKRKVVEAKREVIVCAGALKSPQILEMSGIGGKQVLDRCNVPVLVDLPGVGRNTQDHVFITQSYELVDGLPYQTADMLRDPEVAAEHIKLHSMGTGIHTSGMTGFCFTSPVKVSEKAHHIALNNKKQILDQWSSYSPDEQAQYKIFLDRIDRGAPNCEFILYQGLLPSGMELTNALQGDYCEFPCLSWLFTIKLTHVSKHSISNDPTQDPEYDPKHLASDMDMLVEQAKFVRKLTSTSPLKDIIAREILPGPSVQSDSELKEFVKDTVGTMWHTASSCSMMPREIGGVVDSHYKVWFRAAVSYFSFIEVRRTQIYGTNNIRVADLSIIPIHFAAHPMAMVYAIAEHAAELIKEGRLV